MRLMILLAALLITGCEKNTTSLPTPAAESFVELQAMRDELQSQLHVATVQLETGIRTPDWEKTRARWEPIIERLQGQLVKANAEVNESLQRRYGGATVDAKQ